MGVLRPRTRVALNVSGVLPDRRPEEWSSPFVELRLEADGHFEVVLKSGERVAGQVDGWGAAEPTAIASTTWCSGPNELRLVTTTGDLIVAQLPKPQEPAPLRGRPTVYLDQNHLSTLTKAVHSPKRLDEVERTAALDLVDLIHAGEVLLPMSGGHVAETAKQADPLERYQRALTLAQLSRGWQLLDPLSVRRFELQQALTKRYLSRSLIPPSVITLEPGAVHAARSMRGTSPGRVESSFGERWITDAISSITAIFDSMLSETVSMAPVPGWATQFEAFAEFLGSDPRGSELKQKRTWAKFISDLGTELAYAAHATGVSPTQMSEWTMTHSEHDLAEMPSLGLYRWIMHQKLSDPRLKWEQNDLVDMMYLSVAAGYCDFVAGERKHAAHINAALRRLGRDKVVHRSLASMVAAF